MRKPDIVLEAKVEFTPALLGSGAMEIPLMINRVRYFHREKETLERRDRRRAEVEQIRSFTFFSEHRLLDIQRGDYLLIEGTYNAKNDSYDPKTIHRILGMRDNRPAIHATYYVSNERPTRDQIVSQFPQ